MSPESKAIQEELPELEEIIRNECQRESERRGCEVHPKDPEVQLRVAEIVLNGAGAEMRRNHPVTDPPAHDPADPPCGK